MFIQDYSAHDNSVEGGGSDGAETEVEAWESIYVNEDPSDRIGQLSGGPFGQGAGQVDQLWREEVLVRS